MTDHYWQDRYDQLRKDTEAAQIAILRVSELLHIADTQGAPDGWAEEQIRKVATEWRDAYELANALNSPRRAVIHLDPDREPSTPPLQQQLASELESLGVQVVYQRSSSFVVAAVTSDAEEAKVERAASLYRGVLRVELGRLS